MRQRLDPATLAEQVVAGSRAHIARALTLVESSRPDHRDAARELLTLLRPHTGNAVRVGISGVPGAGKSTFINAMGTRLIAKGHRIAVLAVDPSSSRSGGSVLGDRTRMGALAESEQAFIRPSPSGNHLGGVARATREGMLIMEAAGFDTIWVETVGVGQSEVAVAGMVDTFLLLMLARSGDQLQGIKRGILELADVITVNKADGENAGEARVTARELTIAMKLIRSEDADRRRTPVLTCSAFTGDGLDDVWQAVLDHRHHLEETGSLSERRALQQRDWMWSLVTDDLTTSLRRSPSVKAIARDLERAVEQGELSAVEGAGEILDAFYKDL
ncbi:methylmalonyl Co-A mutase-associated GTPase MeaB [Nigerium massiliense]|uniref:methylmalonyl Co-A mutase-associated GTPase MeaB n=1 Tax=Nigerium massiliense TaxID=1522317 RepID=UPI0005901D9D|nr:methylmalonyl Co-A mutase-associated GTPase MeaB [Nigerium massiliense]